MGLDKFIHQNNVTASVDVSVTQSVYLCHFPIEFFFFLSVFMNLFLREREFKREGTKRIPRPLRAQCGS